MINSVLKKIFWTLLFCVVSAGAKAENEERKGVYLALDLSASAWYNQVYVHDAKSHSAIQQRALLKALGHAESFGECLRPIDLKIVHWGTAVIDVVSWKQINSSQDLRAVADMIRQQQLTSLGGTRHDRAQAALFAELSNRENAAAIITTDEGVRGNVDLTQLSDTASRNAHVRLYGIGINSRPAMRYIEAVTTNNRARHVKNEVTFTESLTAFFEAELWDFGACALIS